MQFFQTYIMIGTYAIGRNPEYFRNPDTFDPTRWLNDSREEMARLSSPFLIGNFGFGARMCIGKRLAEMQIYEAIIYVSLFSFQHIKFYEHMLVRSQKVQIRALKKNDLSYR